MNFKELSAWVEAHPGESILIGGGITIALLWLLGYFSPSASAPAQDPLAAAYYAAEAQQAVVGGQIQQATIAAAAQTAQTGLQANAAVAINAAQTAAATTINGQNTNAAMTINAAQVAGTQAIQLGLSSDQLQATYSNNATALATSQDNNASAVKMNDSNNASSQMLSFLNNILPSELALYGTQGFQSTVGSAGAFTTSELGNPSMAAALGWTPKQQTGQFGWPAP